MEPMCEYIKAMKAKKRMPVWEALDELDTKARWLEKIKRDSADPILKAALRPTPDVVVTATIDEAPRALTELAKLVGEERAREILGIAA